MTIVKLLELRTGNRSKGTYEISMIRLSNNAFCQIMYQHQHASIPVIKLRVVKLTPKK